MSVRYCVIGSINMDLVAGVERFPQPGETLTGTDFGTFPGGKGANQAVALAALGAPVAMVGKVGSDIYGEQYLKNFADRGVDAALVETVPDTSTGVAVIEVDASGENHIVIIPGANLAVDSGFVRRAVADAGDVALFLLQLEIPLSAVTAALSEIRSRGGRVILDPAPVPSDAIPDQLYGMIEVVTPNEHEAELLTGVRVDDAESAERAGRFFLERGVGAAVIKAGGRGAYLVTASGCELIPARKVEVVDSTGAGDSFNAGLAFALGEGLPIREAVEFAAAVGGLACTGLGAQSSMPDLESVKGILAD